MLLRAKALKTIRLSPRSTEALRLVPGPATEGSYITQTPAAKCRRTAVRVWVVQPPAWCEARSHPRGAKRGATRVVRSAELPAWCESAATRVVRSAELPAWCESAATRVVRSAELPAWCESAATRVVRRA